MSSKSRIEAMLFAAGRSVPEETLAAALAPDEDLRDILLQLDDDYLERGVGLVRTAGGWGIRTKEESSDVATQVRPDDKRITRAALETLATIACYQPVTRSEIERIRGVQLSPGVMQQLLEAEFIRPGTRRDTPGRPLTWTVTEEFLESFDLMKVSDLPAYSRLKEAGVFELPRAASAGDDGELAIGSRNDDIQ